MAPVFERQGDRAGGVAAALAALEAKVREPAQVRLVRAEFYAAQALQDTTGRSDVTADQARRDLLSLAGEASVVSRRALATLASQAFVARDYPRARPAFEAYLARYPDSSWSWLAAIHLGETLEALGDADAAASAYRHPVIADAAEPVVRALAAARAGAALDRLGRFGDALVAYRRALETAEAAGLPRHSSALRRGALIERIGQLEQSRQVEHGDLLERGRLALSRGRPAEAGEHLEAFLASAPPAALASSEARALLHRAKLGEALTLATPGHPERDDAAAMQILARLVNEPGGFEVGAAAVARAALLHKAGRAAEARQEMTAALDRMVAAESTPPTDAVAASILEDATAVEATLLRPVQEIPGLGDGHRLRTDTRRQPTVLMVIDRQVRLATGEEVSARVRRAHPGARWVLHLTMDQYRLLERVINTAGRNKPQSLATTLRLAPDPDDGPPFWERFFAPSDQPLCESCPVIFDIEFVDAARTRALVRAATGASGLTRLVMEKRDGQWRVARVSEISTISE
jgi:tetratricopeptide (TPR) repeat protein